MNDDYFHAISDEKFVFWMGIAEKQYPDIFGDANEEDKDKVPLSLSQTLFPEIYEMGPHAYAVSDFSKLMDRVQKDERKDIQLAYKKFLDHFSPWRMWVTGYSNAGTQVLLVLNSCRDRYTVTQRDSLRMFHSNKDNSKLGKALCCIAWALNSADLADDGRKAEGLKDHRFDHYFSGRQLNKMLKPYLKLLKTLNGLDKTYTEHVRLPIDVSNTFNHMMMMMMKESR